MLKLRALVVICFILSVYKTYSQITPSTCDASTPSFQFDLSGNPDSAWLSPEVRRSGLCCDIDPNERPPARCVEFFFYLDEEAVGIIFDINTGAVPPGALFYQINCQGRYQFGDLLCLDGPGPYRLTFCKPGNNPNTYILQSVGPPKVSPPVTVSDGCSANLKASGYDPSTIVWSSVPSNSTHEGYLSCTLGCDSVVAQYEVGAPDSVNYQVCGIPLGGCSPTPVCKQTTVYFVNDKNVDIQPKDAAVCFGNTYATLTAYATGGRPPYQYVWSTGETTQSIDVGEGTYWVEVFDQSSCPTTMDTVEVTAFLYPILADAGPDTTICRSEDAVQLNGSIQEAEGGRWTTNGTGTFSPHDSTLNAVYLPSVDDLDNDSVKIYLTTTGNRSCPGHIDSMQIFFNRLPAIVASSSDSVCRNNAQIILSGSITNAQGGIWSNVNGNFQPSNTTLNAVYTPTASEINSGSVELILTTTGTGKCPPVSDTTVTTFFDPPVITTAGRDSICLNNPEYNYSVTVDRPGNYVWIGGSGSFVPNRNTLSGTYIPSASELIVGNEINLQLRSQNNDGCASVSGALTLFVLPAPLVNAGPDQTICETNTVNLNGTVQNADGGLWLGGAGSFTDRNDLNAIYTPSPTEIDQGYVLLTLESSGNGSCLPVRDQIRVIIQKLPEVDAGTDRNLCASTDTVFLNGVVLRASGGSWSTSGSGVFNPDNQTLNAAYEPSSADATSGQVILYLESSGNGVCSAVSDSLIITFSPSPLITVEDDKTVCTGNFPVSIRANGNSGRWIGDGGLFSLDSTIQNNAYTPSGNEITVGNSKLFYETDSTDVCPSVKDSIVITYERSPEVDAGNDQDLCEGETATVTGSILYATDVLWSTTGDGTFLGPVNQLKTRYLPSAFDVEDGFVDLILQTTDPGICNPVYDTVRLNLQPKPSIQTGPDFLHCPENNSFSVTATVNDAGDAQWTSSNGTGTFNPNPANNATYNLSAADLLEDTLVLVATTTINNLCPPDSDSTQVILTPLPEITIEDSIVACLGDNLLELHSEVKHATGTDWNCTNCSGSFLKINDTLTYYYYSSNDKTTPDLTFVAETYGNGLCSSVADTLHVFFTVEPVITLDKSPICAGDDGGAQLSLDISVGSTSVNWTTSGTGSFDPNNSVEDPKYVPSTADENAGSVWLKVEVTTCITVSDSVEFVITPAPIANAGSDQTICSHNSALLNGQIQNTTGGFWSSTTGGVFLPSDKDLSTEYTPTTLDITNASVDLVLETTGNGICPPDYDTVTVSIIPAPISNPGSDQTVCVLDNYIDVTGSISNASVSTWSSTGSGNFSTPNNLSTRYTFSNSDKLDDHIYLILTASNPGTCNPDVSDSIRIEFFDAPVANAGDDQIVCANDLGAVFDGQIENTATFNWSSDGTGTTSINPVTQNLTYYISEEDKQRGIVNLILTAGSNLYCPEDRDTTVLSIADAPIVTVSEDRAFCNVVPEVPIEGTVQLATDYAWSVDGFGNLEFSDQVLDNNYITVPQDTVEGLVVIYLYATINGGCEAAEQIQVFYEPGPNMTLEDLPACIGDSAMLIGKPTNINNAMSTYQWFKNGVEIPGVTDSVLYVKEPGNYSVNFILDQCQAADESEVTFYEKPIPNNKDKGIICLETDLYTTIDAGPADSWYWYDSKDTIQVIEVEDTAIYNFDLINQYGCKTEDSIIVVDVCPPRVFVPTIITPNGDGKNDFFLVTGAYFTAFEILIFNRWGEVIYESNDPDFRWDGTYRNEAMPVGTYNWRVTYRGYEIYKEEKMLKGSVTIVR